MTTFSVLMLTLFVVGEMKYLDAYHQVLATRECIEMWFIKVMFSLALPGLGKTTARRRLTGEIKFDISSSGEGKSILST